MSVTIYDLAKAAGVSISTVSKALNDSYTISEETKKRIRELAEQMGYRPNVRARSFAKKKSGNVIFAADMYRGIGFENPHLFEIVNGIERYLDKKGYSLILKHVERKNSDKSIREIMLEEQADGVILHGSILTQNLASVLLKESLPHLVIGKPEFTSRVCWIDISHEAAGEIAAEYLLGKGYSRILYMMGDSNDDGISMRRFKGLIGPIEKEKVSIETVKDIISYEQARVAMQEIFERDELPEVVLCSSNYFTIGCLQAIRQKGLSIPRDIALMTFDKYPFSMMLEPAITCVAMDMFELGNQAAMFMLQKISHPNLQTQSFCTTPLLLEREST